MEIGLTPRRSLTAQPLCLLQAHPFGWICEKLSRCTCLLLLNSAARKIQTLCTFRHNTCKPMVLAHLLRVVDASLQL